MSDQLLMIYANISVTPISEESDRSLAKWELKQILLSEVERLFDDNFPDNCRGNAQIAHNLMDYPNDTYE